MSGIVVPGALARLRETDPVLFEALCLKECLGRLGLKGDAVRECAANVADPKTTMFPDQTKPHERCLCLRVTGSARVNEVEVLQQVGGGIHESGVEQTRELLATLAVGPLRCTSAEFPARWESAEDTLRATAADEFITLLRESRALRSINMLAEMLRSKGFEVRR